MRARIPDQSGKYLIFFWGPLLGGSGFFVETDGLVLEEDALLVGED